MKPKIIASEMINSVCNFMPLINLVDIYVFHFLSLSSQGLISLDLEAEDLPSIADHIVKELVNMKQLNEDQSSRLLKALLLKHRSEKQ